MPQTLRNGGVREIRTLAPVTRSNDLANRPLQPLEYHSSCINKMAGAEGLEPSTNGFGDHYSTN